MTMMLLKYHTVILCHLSVCVVLPQDEIQIMHFWQENPRNDVALSIVHRIRRHMM